MRICEEWEVAAIDLYLVVEMAEMGRWRLRAVMST